ncbi:Single domain Von Willebrand factor type C domain [Trinorchestia longiramus]|nr:Single domain Von Willebrand factor type C domain [Trinorchestia longiramus]
MKLTVTIALCVTVVAALPQEAPKSGPAKTPGGALGVLAERDFSVRDLPADQLRDFPGVCFGSTTFRFYKIGESWPLSPFCGIATCLTDGRHLVERVRDCGLMPKENPKCKVANLKDRNQTFPVCCPKFECEDGVELEYPTPEELQAFAQKARQAQIAAAAAQQQQLLQAQSLQGPNPIARG